MRMTWKGFGVSRPAQGTRVGQPSLSQPPENSFFFSPEKSFPEENFPGVRFQQEITSGAESVPHQRPRTGVS